MIHSTPPCASTAKRWSFFSSLFSHAAMRHRSAPISPVDRCGSVDTTSSPFVMRKRPHSTPASVGTTESNTDQGPTVNRRSASVARILKPFWMLAKLGAMAVLVVSALRSADDHVVRPPGFRSPSCPPPGVRQITKLSALRDSDPQVVRPSGSADHQIVRPSGFRSPSCPPPGVRQIKRFHTYGSRDKRSHAPGCIAALAATPYHTMSYH